MRFKVRLDPNAHRDFNRHVDYFQSKVDLVSRVTELEDDLLGTLAFIGEQPFLRREVYPNVRHEALRVFTYHVWYRTYEGADLIDVFAILHQAVNRSAVEARF